MSFKQLLLAALLIISPLILLATDYYVATTGLNVRRGAGKEYPIAFTLLKGDKVEVLVRSGDWYKIKHSKNTGYASAKYLKPISNFNLFQSEHFQVVFLAVAVVAVWLFKRWRFEIKRKQRRDYYRNEYLQSAEWQRKRYVVLKRDNWQCVYCGAHATQVHHKRYAKRNIGNEPISWLVSICKPCHETKHN